MIGGMSDEQFKEFIREYVKKHPVPFIEDKYKIAEEGGAVMKTEVKIKIHNFWRNHLLDLILLIALVFAMSACVCNILNFYYHVETLEYVNADFEWVDDFQNYEICIVHEDKPHYLTIKDNKVKFIYANEDFLNFVVVDYSRRIKDKLDKYSVEAFYINLNYKENKDE